MKLLSDFYERSSHVRGSAFFSAVARKRIKRNKIWRAAQKLSALHTIFYYSEEEDRERGYAHLWCVSSRKSFTRRRNLFIFLDLNCARLFFFTADSSIFPSFDAFEIVSHVAWSNFLRDQRKCYAVGRVQGGRVCALYLLGERERKMGGKWQLCAQAEKTKLTILRGANFEDCEITQSRVCSELGKTSGLKISTSNKMFSLRAAITENWTIYMFWSQLVFDLKVRLL